MKQPTDEAIEAFENAGNEYDPYGPRLAECPYCDTLTQYASDHCCSGLQSQANDPLTDR